jgi:general secretion pathway protein G
MSINRYARKGFTLVEILIVVIILGILAAIVIPQFTNASTEARESSLRSTLQTLRSQVELFKLQHLDRFPLADLDDITSAWSWDMLTTKTDQDGTADANGFGPYLQQKSTNSLRNGATEVVSVADDATALASTTASDSTDGFVFSQATGKIWAYNKDGAVFID